MLWHILKYLLCFSVEVFYKRGQVKNAKNIRVKGPVIIAMNHPNAFMDPIAFTVKAYPPKVMYLARGDVFKPGLISTLLESIGIVPIFRVQDGGKEGLKKNDETYRRVNHLLDHNNKIIIFAEGLCVQERRLRPLKKGVPRMVFGAMKAINHPELMVVPVCVNYDKPKNFRSNIFFNIGEPMYVRDYMSAYEQAPAKTMNVFLQELEGRMKELIVHINDPANDDLVEHIEEISKRDLLKAKGLDYKNLDHDHQVSMQIVETINQAAEIAPDKVAELRNQSNAYLKKLRKLGLRDWLVNPRHAAQVNAFVLTLRAIALLAGLPVYLLGLIGNYIPYRVSGALPQKLVKHVEFFASFAIGIGSLLFPVYYLLQFFIIYALAPHIGWPFLAVFVFIMSGWFSLHYSPFRKKTVGIMHALRLRKDKAVWQGLQDNRRHIVQLYERLEALPHIPAQAEMGQQA